MTEGVSIIIPAFNGGELFKKCLSAIRSQDYPGEVQLIVIDSGSEEGSLAAATEAGALLRQIPKERFHHARTRNEALCLAVHRKVVYLVQDAIPASRDWLRSLTESLREARVAAAYARQIPHADADVFARFEVEHHSEYLGERPMLQGLRHPEEFVSIPYDQLLRTIRLDNVCAIYRKELLTRFPFPEVRFGEDMAWSSLIVKQGFVISYRPDIIVRHSHNRPPDYRFRRAIVDSLACAQITGRVKGDLSAYSLKDLLRLQETAAGLAKELRERIRRGETIGRAKARFVLRVAQKLQRTFPCMHFLVGPLFVARFGPPALEYMLKGNVQHILNLVQGRYSDLSVGEILDCLDQAVSSASGRLHGEVYASHMLRKTLSCEMREYFTPLLEGV
jgi:glycosyltransferase involved in cell wall biosynthesis